MTHDTKHANDRTGSPATSRRACSVKLVAFLLTMTFLAAPPALGQSDADELLVPEAERWREFAYGVSFRPPAGFVLREHAAEGALLTMSSPPTGVNVRFFIKKSNIPLTTVLDGDKRKAGTTSAIVNIMEMGDKEMWMHARAVLVTQRLRRVGNQAGGIQYFRVRDRHQAEWAVGQAFMVIDDKTFAMWQMEVDLNRATYGRRVFETVVGDVQVEDPQRLKEWRQRLTMDALRWHDQIDTAVLQSVLIPEQWFKVHHGDRLVGWTLVTQRQANGLEKAEWERDENKQEEDPNARQPQRPQDPRRPQRLQRQPRRQPVQRELPGIRIDVRARVHSEHVRTVLEPVRQVALPGQEAGQVAAPRDEVNLSAIDLDSRLFLSNDGTQELWKRRITIRPMIVQRNALGQVTGVQTHPDVVLANFVEAGYRQDDTIAVDLVGPAGSELSEWPVPPRRIKEKYEHRLPNGDVEVGFEIKDGFCYLSQVELWLLERLLPRNKANEFGFYAYRGPGLYDLPGVNTHAQEVKGNLSFRMVRSVPRTDGTLRIEMYPTLDRVAEIALYDQLGELVSRTFGTGLRLTPTTADELAALKAKFQ